jgi:hypothetical protein
VTLPASVYFETGSAAIGAEGSIVMQPPMFVTGAVNDREARRVDITRP